MRRKAASSRSKTLGMDTVLPNHPAFSATLPPLSARASGFRGTVVPLSQPKTTVNNIVLGVVTYRLWPAMIGAWHTNTLARCPPMPRKTSTAA